MYKSLFMILAITMMILPGCNSVFNRYSITGTVAGDIGSKQNMGNDTTQGSTKFSVQLNNLTVVEGSRSDNFGSGGVAIINCTSTQCATLSDGTVAEFNCYEEIHWGSPNEEECRFARIVSAP